MKRIAEIFFSLIILPFLCACGLEHQLFDAANEPITIEPPILNNPIGSSAFSEEPNRPVICFNGYEWGEDFIRILSEKTAGGKLQNTEYTYNENVGPFTKELVFTEEYAGYPFRCYYDFDHEDRLVSVMLLLNQELSAVDVVSLQYDLNKAFISRFGPWDTASGLFDPESGESLREHADSVKAGKKVVTAVWYGSCNTQLFSKCQLNSTNGQIDLILVFSTTEYSL